jgi:acetyl-CoA carboxylase biotin carboxyl carrier protein
MELKDIEKLLGFVEKSGFSEFSWKRGDEEVYFCKQAPSPEAPASFQPPAWAYAPPPPGSIPHAHAPSQAAQAVAAAAPSEAVAAGLEVIKSPIVGTFYRAASPDAEPFVKPGSKVKKGQVLCILEAMKVMNQFEAEFDCEIVRILPENGSLVEYGAPLFEAKRV